MKKNLLIICLVMVFLFCSCSAGTEENTSSAPLIGEEEIGVLSPAPEKPSETPTPEPTVSGWYLTGWEYIISSTDITLVGLMEKGGGLLDYNEGTGEKNNFTISFGRKYANETMVASGSATTTWTDPADFLTPGEKVVITVNRETPSSWGINSMNVNIDNADILPGYSTSSAIAFQADDGNAYLANYSGNFTSSKAMPVDNSLYTLRSIILNLGNGFGFRYHYEWRD